MPCRIKRPLRYSRRLVKGVGVLVSVKDVFVPSVEPDGVSSSTKRGPPPPLLLPQGPDVPSTRTQSSGFPMAALSNPEPLMTAALEFANPFPLTGRTSSSD